MNTIIEIDYIKYTENVIVNSQNIIEVQKEIKNNQWKYVIKGEILIPKTYSIIEIKRTRDINTQCPWETIITTYKKCTVVLNDEGRSKYIELPKRETHITNSKIESLIYGYVKK